MQTFIFSLLFLNTLYVIQDLAVSKASLWMVSLEIILIELFSLGRTAEALRAIIGSNLAISLHRGPVDPKFQVEGVAPHQPFFFSEN